MNVAFVDKVLAAIIASICGLIAAFTTYYFLGFILKPIKIWLIKHLTEVHSNG